MNINVFQSSVRAWYIYDPSSGPVDQPGVYFKANYKPTCRNGSQICAIYAEDSGDYLNFVSDNLLQYIADGLSTGLAQPLGNVKKYIYLRNP